MNVGPDVAIVGAGPNGVSIAAHLRSTDVTFRIFGRPMRTWRERMPNGVLFKAGLRLESGGSGVAVHAQVLL